MFATPAFAAELEAVMRPVERARGLPNALYASPEALALERDKVFHSGWASIGFGADIPAPGDVAPIDWLGAPLLMARDRDGEVRVFENVCRHRGMILVEERRNFGGVIRCPYHSWCYSLDGKLRATPHVGGPGVNRHEAIDPAATGLTEVRSALFMDVVFVNLDGKAPDFADWSAGLRAQIGDFADRPIFHGGPESGFAFDLNTNWKLVVENNAESYHLPWVHPGLSAYSRLEDHYHLPERGGFSGQGTSVYAPDYGALPFPDFPALDGRWATAAEYPCFFPNTFFAVHRDHVWAGHLAPRAHDRTVERIEIYYTTEEAARSDRFAALRAENAKRWRSVLAEDVFVTEGMQRGRGAPGFAGGVFSPAMDAPTHAFHAWIAARLAA